MLLTHLDKAGGGSMEVVSAPSLVLCIDSRALQQELCVASSADSNAAMSALTAAPALPASSAPAGADDGDGGPPAAAGDGDDDPLAAEQQTCRAAAAQESAFDVAAAIAAVAAADDDEPPLLEPVDSNNPPADDPVAAVANPAGPVVPLRTAGFLPAEAAVQGLGDSLRRLSIEQEVAGALRVRVAQRYQLVQDIAGMLLMLQTSVQQAALPATAAVAEASRRFQDLYEPSGIQPEETYSSAVAGAAGTERGGYQMSEVAAMQDPEKLAVQPYDRTDALTEAANCIIISLLQLGLFESLDYLMQHLREGGIRVNGADELAAYTSEHRAQALLDGPSSSRDADVQPQPSESEAPPAAEAAGLQQQPAPEVASASGLLKRSSGSRSPPKAAGEDGPIAEDGPSHGPGSPAGALASASDQGAASSKRTPEAPAATRGTGQKITSEQRKCRQPQSPKAAGISNVDTEALEMENC